MRISIIVLLVFMLAGCKGINKILKSNDPQYKLRMAEQYFAKKKWAYAQQLYEDVMPFFKAEKEFEDIYYKYAMAAYNQKDYMNAENLFKTYLEIFPNSAKAEEVDYLRAYTFYLRSPKPELDQTNTIKTIGMMQVFVNTHPGSSRVAEANQIIDELRGKLETKDYKAAKLYYDLGQFRAAAVTFTTVSDNYPESNRADEYKYMAIRSYYRYAELSVVEKQTERFEKVIAECQEFIDRFPQSGLVKDVNEYITLSQSFIKNLSNEPAKTST
jgi:outer membrane protein assembly factor BamD